MKNRQLRSRIAGILRSKYCFDIRFRIDNIGIQTYMYTYVAQAILEDRIHVELGGGQGYDHRSNTITFTSEDIPGPVIVHEATHAVLDATHVGLEITRGTHEAAAYIAETIYGRYTNETISVYSAPLARRLSQVALEIIAFNTVRKSGLFVCDHEDSRYIKALVGNLGLAGNPNRRDTMNGIPF